MNEGEPVMPRISAILAPSATRVVLTALLAGSLALAGCSSSTNGDAVGAPQTSGARILSSVPPSSPTASASTDSGTANTTSLQTSLKAIALQPSDFPSGWKATSSDSTDDTADDEEAAELRKCVGLRDTTPDRVLKVNSDDYTQGSLTVSSFVSVYHGQAAVDSDIALLNSPKINSCFQKQFENSLGDLLDEDTKITDFSLKIEPTTEQGPGSVVAHGYGAVTFGSSGRESPVSAEEETFYMGVAFIVGAKLQAQVSYFGVGEDMDLKIWSSVVAEVAERAGKA